MEPSAIFALSCVFILFILVLFVLGISLAAAAAKKRRRRNPDRKKQGQPVTAAPLPYECKKYLLSRAELEFFRVLQTVVPAGYTIIPQVRLANLVYVRLPRRSPQRLSHFNRISAKCVDFVICKATNLSPQLVIELDDSSHARPDRQERDDFVDEVMETVGLPILHIPWQRSYQADKLLSLINAELGLPDPAQETDEDIPAETHSHTASPAQDKHCEKCYAPVKPHASFCPQCGAAIAEQPI